MPWDNIFHLVIGIDCAWLFHPCTEFHSLLHYQDVVFIPALLLLAIGFVTCLRALIRIVEPARPRPHEQMRNEFLVSDVVNQQRSNTEAVVQQLMRELD